MDKISLKIMFEFVLKHLKSELNINQEILNRKIRNINK